MFMDLDNAENKDVRISFNLYRFFGDRMPSTDMVERLMTCNTEIIDDLQRKDEIYLPALRIEGKLLFQHEK